MIRLRAYGASARHARGALLCCAAVLALSATTAAQKSVKAGVYTAAQAGRGETIFKSGCASCHTPGYFTDDNFYTNYANKPLWELFDVISDSMPEDNPGSLKKEEYADVIAFILQLNKFPAGDVDLPVDKDTLTGIVMEKP